MSQQPLRRVLIVDDEPSVREMLAIALKMAGFEVSDRQCIWRIKLHHHYPT